MGYPRYVAGSPGQLEPYLTPLLATGLISTWFVEDLMLSRDDAPVKHVIQAVGSSSLEKGRAFTATVCPQCQPTIYGSYEEMYQDPNVDIVYIGTPHGLHKRNCLDAIAAGKAVFCEKAFTLNARDAKEVFVAAKEKGVYVAEAMWLRHRPVFRHIRKLLHEDKAIGEVFRAYSDFGDFQDIANLPPTSRHRNPELGAGSLLDLGIYSLTWVSMALDHRNPEQSETPSIHAFQTHLLGTEVGTSVLLQYPSSGRQGVITSTHQANGFPDILARIQGTEGHIDVHGPGASDPIGFTIYTNYSGQPGARERERKVIKSFDYSSAERGYQYEADNAALDVFAGRLESAIMPWAETIRILEVMDEIRRQGGTVYVADKEP